MESSWTLSRCRAPARRLPRRRHLAASDEIAPLAETPSQPNYSGTCDEIGHSFPVVPGSDPVHDRDGDGVACESQ